ncbi:hypothetical protein [Azoarcus olearius]|uniref:hypothetical protein n=1 Tax=Azoarcus sp. (strain BH72) TaxID=418699 RepID=UPI0012ED43A4|nr:hypothetical protein [Azoarcus olearius]
MIVLRTTNARGMLCGESQPMCRYSDTVVALARALRAEGWTIRAIAARLDGPHPGTVHRWCTFERRKPAVRVSAKRIKPHSSDVESVGNGAAAALSENLCNPASNRPSFHDDSTDLA